MLIGEEEITIENILIINMIQSATSAGPNDPRLFKCYV
jgi:hypothetical protein